MSRTLFTALLSLTILPVFCLRADTKNFSGDWQINQAQSQEGRDKNLSLDVQQNGSQITVTRVYRENGRKEIKATFTCTINGNNCSFDEDGHKADVSLWYDGPQLVMLKTNGPREDPTVEWHLQLSPDGNTLTVSRENMATSGKPEKLVFNKAQAVANNK